MNLLEGGPGSGPQSGGGGGKLSGDKAAAYHEKMSAMHMEKADKAASKADQQGRSGSRAAGPHERAMVAHDRAAYAHAEGRANAGSLSAKANAMTAALKESNVYINEVGRKVSAKNEAKIQMSVKALQDILTALNPATEEEGTAPAKEAAKPAGASPTIQDTIDSLQKLIDTLSPKAKEDLEGDGDGDNDKQNAIVQKPLGQVLLKTGAQESFRENIGKLVPKLVQIALRETEIDLWEKAYSPEQRAEMAKKGHAIPVKNDKGEVVGGSFPIADENDLENAKSSFGRNPTPEVKAHINKRAAALGQPKMGDTKAKEAGVDDGDDEVEVLDEADWDIFDETFMELAEGAVAKDGTIEVKIIRPGWGSSGYYGKEVLSRDGPKAFPVGTKMFWDHPTQQEERERPERSVRDLAAKLVETPRYVENHPKGPGLYSRAQTFSKYREDINELAPHIGVSIRALGRGVTGEAEGKKGKIVEEIRRGQSIDFVTAPGAGGEVLSLFESAKGPREPKEDVVSEQQLKEAQARLKEREDELAELRERVMKDDATKYVAASLEKLGEGLKPVTIKRLTAHLCEGIPTDDDGDLDKVELTKNIKEAIKAERQYLQEVVGATGRVVGMGGSSDDSLFSESDTPLDEDKVGESLEESFRALGLSEAVAKQAAAGRR